MTDTAPDHAASPARRAQARIIAPVSGPLRRAGLLSVGAGLVWPVQATLIAWAVAGWADGTVGLEGTALAAAGFALCGALRAGLDWRAGGLLFDAADAVIARERAALLRREARAVGARGSAEAAALIAQKLPMLQPWITRYHVAMTRVMILPPALLALCFSISWAVGLALLVAGPLIPVLMALAGMAAERASRRQLAEIGAMNGMLMDRLSAMLDIRLLGAGARSAADFEARAEGLRARTMAVLRIAFLSSTLLELFAALGVALAAVWVGFTLLGQIGFGGWGGELTLFQGLFLLLLAPDYFQPLRDLAAAWHDRAAGLAVVADLDAFDAMERAGFVGSGAAAAALPGALTLAVSGAAAALPGRAHPLPDFALAEGEAVALTGPSGAGKSTALAAVAGLLPLARGSIAVCGVPLDAAAADAWRARVALVPQAPHFPDRRLADWLDPALGDPGPALALAHARGVVARLPQGLETRLGETGGGVSGGEARRLMLARAVLRKPDLLLADEPTADLDAETAALVIDSLARLKAAGVTLLVATHDPAVVAAMDREVAA